MKKLLLAGLLTLAFPISVWAAGLPANYQAIYCYPSGSYWQAHLVSHYQNWTYHL